MFLLTFWFNIEIYQNMEVVTKPCTDTSFKSRSSRTSKVPLKDTAKPQKLGF